MDKKELSKRLKMLEIEVEYLKSFLKKLAYNLDRDTYRIMTSQDVEYEKQRRIKNMNGESGIYNIRQENENKLYFVVDDPADRYFEVVIEWDKDQQQYVITANDSIVAYI